MSPSGFDWDFAWINCQCVKIGPGELDIDPDGTIKSWQLNFSMFSYSIASDNQCTSRGLPKPKSCEQCPVE